MEKRNPASFFNWVEAFQAGVESAGGKGWNLGRLQRYGFRVPGGGILAAEVYQLFMATNNLLEDTMYMARGINIDNIENRETEEKLNRIRKNIEAGQIPQHIEKELISKLTDMGLLEKPLAIRSSATAEDSNQASFAGIHESYLNVKGLDNILSSIKSCYASLWTPRAVAYRRKMNIKDDEVWQAVAVMEMVEAEAAGVGFTCDPRTGREDIVLISANFGLGESLVSGAVEPDEYCLDYWYDITEKRIGRKEGKTIARESGGTDFVRLPESAARQVLSDEQIRQLALIIKRVMDALGGGDQHQDIEWVFDGRDFILVQARPVTAMPRYTFAELKNQPDIWSNGNFKDAMPMVQSTLNWSLLLQTPRPGLELCGFKTLPGLQNIKRFGGRLYWNLALQQWIFFDALGLLPHQTNEALGGHQPEIKISENKPFHGIKGLKRIWRILQYIRLNNKISGNAQAQFNKVDIFTDTLINKSFADLSDADLINHVEAIQTMLYEFNPVFFACAMSANMNPLTKTLTKYFPVRAKVLTNALMTGRGNITSAEHGYRLVEMAEIARGDASARDYLGRRGFDPDVWEKELPDESPFKRLFRNFLAEYGHRGVYEMDIYNPRWREDPAYLLHVIKSTMETANTGELQERQKAKAQEVWREVEQGVPAFRRGRIKRQLEQAVKGMELREMAKSELVKIYGDMRIVALEIGHRLQERGILPDKADVFHCSWPELGSILKGDWNGRGLGVMVMERKQWRQKMEELSSPDFFIDDAPQYVEPVSQALSHALKGLGVSTGRASGPARLIYHPHQGEKLKDGDVLVAPTTDPGWTPLFLRASAIVVESGGAGSHGAIVAREYGIPAVLNIPGVMQLIQDDQNVVVDGDEGKVFLSDEQLPS
ncbi:MAG: PEP/pyruvate-binding domain-containing protein [Syntrophomonas sp.]|uniref:PEP/pyruvate-binding domain-containing protein n=1 Tax=Syntrophomonas sp. TaxID=2053627 RepID=UPI00261B7563|nr:PEP/pyruvate-binding domain-containing protein [Syntrophomonas sp.]MDD2511126.1 PEP/pyruvate-binding domain-containing protein [Syntrophomonas sp.]MDD3879774.1 PEP/pyruvate-binding domain-containing protein [Syntrophomonas sp.]MDD4627204.1 PEP/pyruvate-binding domain-containing protein [Syntrophomonas sp.]